MAQKQKLAHIKTDKAEKKWLDKELVELENFSSTAYTSGEQ